MSDVEFENEDLNRMTKYGYNCSWKPSFPVVLNDYVSKGWITLDTRHISCGVLNINIVEVDELDNVDYIEMVVDILSEADASEIAYDKFSGEICLWWD